MRIYSIALPSDLAYATERSFRKTVTEAAVNYVNLICARLDPAFGEAVLNLAKTAPDTPATRAWTYTIACLTQMVGPEQPVPSAALLGHIEADGSEAERLFELLCWDGVGAACQKGLTAGFELPGAPPRLLSIGVEGAFLVGEHRPTSCGWKLIATEDVALTGPGFAATSSCLDPLWKPNIRIESSGLDACIPLNSPALMNRDFQEFPMVRSGAYASAWSHVLRRAADSIGEYSRAAAACVREFVRCVVPLVGGEGVIGSASREQALGLVFLPGSDRPDEVTECLLHEAMHQYLFRIEECGDLFTADTDVSEGYYSPWRTDPRPLRMTLHGAFVFAAVADLYLWEAAPQVLRLDKRECIRRSYYRGRQVRMALDTVLRNVHLTMFGRVIVEMVEHDLSVILDGAEPAFDDRAAVDAILTEHNERYVAYAR